MKSFKILIAEDDDVWCDTLTTHIKTACRACITEATSTCKDAWAKLNADSHWDLFIADLTLPGDSEKMGFNLIQKARQLNIPTIVVSGTADPEEAITLIDSGDAKAFFSKNRFRFSEVRFIETVKHILQPPALVINPSAGVDPGHQGTPAPRDGLRTGDGTTTKAQPPDRDDLLIMLENSLPAVLEEIIFKYGIPSQHLSTASHTERAIGLIRYAESRNELKKLQSIIFSLD